MASTDDVFRDTSMLLDALFRTPPDAITNGMGQAGSFPGLVPRTYHVAQQARDASSQALTTLRETATLLDAVNDVTLGRLETEINDIKQAAGRVETAVNDSRGIDDQAFGRIEAVLKNVMEFLPTVRADLSDLASRLDTLAAEQQQAIAGLNAKLDALKAEVQGLPH